MVIGSSQEKEAVDLVVHLEVVVVGMQDQGKLSLLRTLSRFFPNV